MASIKSRDFVGIAEGIKTHELSTKGKIESLKNTLSELNGRKSYIESNIASLEAALAAAYEDTDEDGDPDYSLISSIEAQIESAENELSGVAEEINTNNGELAQTQIEFESVQEEKAQTLFEIRERARQTSSNISVAGGMYGAYAGVASTLQSSLQSSLSSLTQAANILGGSVDSAVGGGVSSGGSSNTTSGDVGGDSSLSNSSLAAFINDGTDENSSYSTEKYHSEKTEHMTPATTPNFHSGQKTVNPQRPLVFKSEQEANFYASSSFSDNTERESTDKDNTYSTSQTSSNLERNISGSKLSPNIARSDLQKKRDWAKQYEIGYTPVASLKTNKSSESEDISNGNSQRALGKEHDVRRPSLGNHKAAIAFGLYEISNNTRSIQNNTNESKNSSNKNTLSKEERFRKSLTDFTPQNTNTIFGLNIPNAEISQKFIGNVYQRIASADKKSRTLFNYIVRNKQLSFRDGNSSEEYYDIDERCLYLNLKADENDEMGRGTGLFHEVGHAIDHAIGDGTFLSNNEEFLSCLQSDCKRVLAKMSNDTLWSNKFINLIRKSPDAYSISDIMEGLTDGRVRGACGHLAQDNNYWKNDKYAVCNEAFAHFFEASMGAPGNRLKYIKTVFPSAYAKYQEMISSFTDGERDELIKERER